MDEEGIVARRRHRRTLMRNGPSGRLTSCMLEDEALNPGRESFHRDGTYRWCMAKFFPLGFLNGAGRDGVRSGPDTVSGPAPFITC